MSSATLQPTSVRDRPLTLRMRSDLVVRCDRSGVETMWIIKDPITLEYFHLREREYCLLQMLDGTRSLNGLKQAFEQRFPGDRLSPRRLHAFCLAMQRDGLLIGPAENARSVIERKEEFRQAQRTERLTNVLAMRFRGIDPQPLLDRLYPLLRPFFIGPMLAAALLCCLGVFLFVAVRFDLFREQLPAMGALFSGTNLLLLALAVAATKIIHELAHALCCKHFGGECREIGAMLLVFTPCLYCDVSDAWMIPSRWRRMAISAAGMFAETLLAALCLVLWWFSVDGPLRLFFLHTILACTVATLVFNANPLLRFDGYYMFSDWLGVPNLWTRSRSLLAGLCERLCLGNTSHVETGLPPATRVAMIGYAVASIAYRWLVIVAIAWMFVTLLKPYGLGWLAYAAVAAMIASAVVPPLWSVKRRLADPLQRRRINRFRLGMAFVVGCCLVVALLFIPLPHSTRAEAVVRLNDAANLFASREGIIAEHVEYDSQVASGDVIVTITNAELERRLVKLRGERDRQSQRLQTLRTLRGNDPSIAAEIPTATETLRDYEHRLAELERELGSLAIKANRDGWLFPPEQVESDTATADPLQPLAPPLTQASRGRYVAIGEHLGQIGNPQDLHAEITLGSAGIEHVRLGQAVELKLLESASNTIIGEVIDVSPASSRADGTVGDEYRIRVAFDASELDLTVGARGIATIRTEPISLGWRAYRSVRQLFTLGR